MIPITMVKVGDKGSIKNILGSDEVRRHLEHLGFVLGQDVIVVAEISGDLILHVKDARIALNKSMAKRIMVQQVDSRKEIII